MSRDDTTADDKAVVPYAVGYGKPPAERQFKAGKSGNPRGRPRKASVPQTRPVLGCSLEVDQVLLGEAYRTVTLREGDQPVTLTTVSAVYRSLALSGLKGNRLAAKAFVEQVEKAESRRRASVLELIDIAQTYKNDWSHAIEMAQQRGLAPPQIYPHPDDIVMGPDGLPMVVGPNTKAEQAHWEGLQARARKYDEAVRQALAGWKSKLKRDVQIQAFYFDDMVYDHRARLLMRLVAPDEATRRAHGYRRPSRSEFDAFHKASKATYRVHKELTEAERRKFIWEIERYERDLKGHRE